MPVSSNQASKTMKQLIYPTCIIGFYMEKLIGSDDQNYDITEEQIVYSRFRVLNPL